METHARLNNMHVAAACTDLMCLSACELEDFVAAFNLRVGDQKSLPIPYCQIDGQYFYYARNLVRYLECQSVSIIIRRCQLLQCIAFRGVCGAVLTHFSVSSSPAHSAAFIAHIPVASAASASNHSGKRVRG